MDAVILSVTLGLALLGAFWGFLRILSLVLALLGGVLLGRFAGPPLANLLFPSPPSSGQQLLASALAGALACGLLLLAAMGLRRLLEALHLRLMDRLLGAVATAGMALALSALLLGLAAQGGLQPQGALSEKLAAFGQAFFQVYKETKRSQIPQSNPKNPTNKGQQPKGP